MTQKRKHCDKQFKIAAARVVLGGEMRAVDLARELGIKDSTLRRWAQEYEEMGEDAFPGNGSPKVNEDYEIVKLRKRTEEPECESGLLNNFRAFLSQDHVRGAGSSKSMGRVRLHQEGMRDLARARIRIPWLREEEECGCRASMGGGMSAGQTTQLTENRPQLTVLRTRLSLTCIVFSDTHARGTDRLECKSTTTKGRCHVEPSRQVHRRVQARDRRLRDLDGKADLGMLQGTGPQFQDGQPMGDKAQAGAFRPARPEGRGPRAARGQEAHTRARDGERVPEKSRGLLRQRAGVPRATASCWRRRPGSPSP